MTEPVGLLARRAVSLWWRLLTCRFRGHPRYDVPVEYEGAWYWVCGCGLRLYGRTY